MRRRCVWCVPNHVMDEGGLIKEDDEVTDSMCPEAAAKVAAELRAMNEAERALITGADKRAEDYIERLKEEQADDGTLRDDDFKIKVCGVCILGILALLALAAIASL